MTSENSTMETSTTDHTMEATTTTTTTTTTAGSSKSDDGMSSGMMIGIIIGSVVGFIFVVCIMTIFVMRYRAKRRKGSEKYKQAKKELKIDKLPSPSEIESAEIRPLERKPTNNSAVDTDLSSSTHHYQNISNTKYENVDKERNQPIYMEPKGEDKRIYNTAEGSEYYTVDEGRTPKLPNRDDGKQQKQNVSKNKKSKGGKKTAKGNSKQNNTKPSQTKESETSDSSDSESDTSNSRRDYINLQKEQIVPPQHISKQQTQKLVVDDVYENEEVHNSTSSKSKR